MKKTIVAAAVVAGVVGAVAVARNVIAADDVPTVYFTRDISSAGLVRAYNALGWTPSGRVGIKMSTGESGKSNYLRPELIKDLVANLDGTIVECNTAYGGNRSDSKSHWAAIRERGFMDVAPVDIMDEEGSMTLPVNGGNVLSENYVGTHFANYPSYVVLSHFKGHAMAGFGGALKNISIGFASSMGKKWIHSGGTSKESMWGGEQNAFLESMADAAKSVVEYVGRDNMVYINVLNRISIDCDCDGNPAEPDIHDIGILVSTDPVAIDQAGIDMVSVADGNQKLMERIADRNGLHTLEAAEKIGVGSRKYKLVNLDE